MDMHAPQTATVVNETDAKVIALEQQLREMSARVARVEEEQQVSAARARMAEFLHCVERNQG